MKPIIMSTENVKAILNGRKTQTRRVIRGAIGRTTAQRLPLGKPQPVNTFGNYWEWQLPKKTLPFHRGMVADKFARIGDKLWLRETWRVADGKEYTLTAPEYEGGQNQAHIKYKANDPHPENVKWRPSIFMPRWASRITLEIIGVRVERLQDITRSDAQEEGMVEYYARQQFMALWDNLNRKRGFEFDINPWVWVIDFRLDLTKEIQDAEGVAALPQSHREGVSNQDKDFTLA